MKTLVALILLCSSNAIDPGLRRDRWVVWNVGQGLWTTARVDRTCFHFDTGGERWPMRDLRRLCAGSDNRVTLSHSDWDHVGGLRALSTQVGRTCLIAAPQEKVTSEKKKSLWRDLPPCAGGNDVAELRWVHRGRSTNGASRVFEFEKRFLIPGDSPAIEERRWSDHFTMLSPVQVLVLGHHGSRTSTSELLLRRLPHLRLAIASARKKKYGHPHPEVVARLRKFRVGLLRTEDWGHLIFEL